MENLIALPSKQMKSNELLEVAKIGKTVGLQGGLKLHSSNDFPHIFSKGVCFETEKMGILEISSCEVEKNLIFFKHFDTPELAQKLVNTVLYMSKNKTKELCTLKKDEFFWFDIEGCDVYEEGVLLGVVQEIQRIAGNDFLDVKTAQKVKNKKTQKNFLIPYVDFYIKNVDIQNKSIEVVGGLALLESL